VDWGLQKPVACLLQKPGDWRRSAEMEAVPIKRGGSKVSSGSGPGLKANVGGGGKGPRALRASFAMVCRSGRE
jgi:hypothetical protein